MKTSEFYEKEGWINFSENPDKERIIELIGRTPTHFKKSHLNTIFLRDCVGVWRIYIFCSDRSILSYKIHLVAKTIEEINLTIDFLSLTAFLVDSDAAWQQNAAPGMYRVRPNELT